MPYTHMPDGQPRLFCMHFWTNYIQKLARGLEAALDRARLRTAGQQLTSRAAESLRATWAKLRQCCIVHSTAKRKCMEPEATETSQKSQGAFVTYSPQEHGYRDSHERVTRTEIGRKLAALKRYAFAGEYDCSVCYSGPVYFIPSDTLLAREATDLGIRGEHDLFGGVVPHPFVATKAITHPLVDPDAMPRRAGRRVRLRVQDAVLDGFTAFCPEDARRAGCTPARARPVRASSRSARPAAAGRPWCPRRRRAGGAARGDRPGGAAAGLVLEENLAELRPTASARCGWPSL